MKMNAKVIVKVMEATHPKVVRGGWGWGSAFPHQTSTVF